ncbi:hypothetical protein O6H91_09G093900 [Diphasiastrum complanatum]|uniref:Uncharacterized protein n=1 Tax=Diphasiastrum complanatum TaxID=34168 RepID=A0ACC2CRT8_DIPCM|nr:hypothetical protein O6H91_09G093900 [Diphasiastrum complanatum]
MAFLLKPWIRLLLRLRKNKKKGKKKKAQELKSLQQSSITDRKQQAAALALRRASEVEVGAAISNGSGNDITTHNKALRMRESSQTHDLEIFCNNWASSVSISTTSSLHNSSAKVSKLSSEFGAKRKRKRLGALKKGMGGFSAAEREGDNLAVCELRNDAVEGVGPPKRKKKRKTRLDVGNSVFVDGESTRKRAEESCVPQKGKLIDEARRSTKEILEYRTPTQPCSSQNLSEHGFTCFTNLDVVRGLRTSSVTLHRKMELSLKYVELQQSQTQRSFPLEKSMPMRQFVLFLSEWVQSALILSSKQEVTQSILHKFDAPLLGSDEGNFEFPAYSDIRSWDILKWCLSSGHMQNGTSISSRLLHPITSLLKVATCFYNESTTSHGDSSSSGKSRSLTNNSEPSKSCWVETKLNTTYMVTLLHHSSDVLDLILSSNSRSFRPSLGEWIALVLRALDIVTLVSKKDVVPALQGLKDVFQRSAVIVLQGFLKFLTSYPNQKLVFQTIVERLLESLLDVFGQLSLRFETVLPSVQQRENQKLVTILEEVLQNGLFHAAHLEGFSNVCSIGCFTEHNCTEVGNHRLDHTNIIAYKEKESHGFDIPLSYHRLFFHKIEQLRNQSNFSALRSLGWLFRTYARKLKTRQHIVGVSPDPHFILTEEETASQHKHDSENLETPLDQLQLNKIAYPSERLFSVFAELLIPLRNEIQKLTLFEKNLECASKLSKIQSVMVAANGLLAAARDQHAYVPVEDTPTNSHMSFIKEFHSILMQVGGFIINLQVELFGPTNGAHAMRNVNRSQSSLDNDHGTVAGVLLAEVLEEVIDALGHLLELEYKVFEDHLAGTWLLILSSVSLWYALKDDDLHSVSILEAEKKAVHFGGRIFHIFSDLRKVQLPLHVLCAMLTSLLQPTMLSSNLLNFFRTLDDTNKQQVTTENARFGSYQTAVERVVCVKPFLQKVAASVAALPEGQVAEFMDMLAVDIKVVLDALDDVGKNMDHPYENSGSHISHATAAVKALGDVFTSIIENINVTATNSFQVGMSVRNLVDHTVTQVLSSLIHVANKKIKNSSNVFCDIEAFSPSNVKQKESFSALEECPEIKEFGEERILLTPFKVVLILHIYLACRSLHRQCVILMSPKKAKQACAVVHMPVLAGNDWSNIVTELSQEGFFSWIEGSLASVFDMCICLNSISRSWIEKVPSISCIMDRMRMLRVADLDRYIQAVKFIKEMIKVENAHLNENDPLMGSASYEFSKGFKGMVDSLLTAYRDEAVLLASSWMDDVLCCTEKLICCNAAAIFCPNLSSSVILGSSERTHSCADLMQYGVFSETANYGTDIQFECDYCQRLITENSFPLARWSLLCNSTDIWSKHVNDESRESFICFLFQFCRPTRRRNFTGSEQESHVTVNCTCRTTCALQFLTCPGELLRSLSFYEEEGYRDSDCPMFTAEAISQEQQWADYVDRIGRIISTNLDAKEKLPGISRYIQSESVVKSFDRCSCLLHVLTFLPRGYLHNNDISMCLNAVMSLERFLLESMLCQHFSPSVVKGSSLESMWKFLNLFGECRRALEFLFLSIDDIRSTIQPSADMSVLFGNVNAFRWFSISVRVAAICVHHLIQASDQSRALTKEDSSQRNCWKDALGFLYECTKNVTMYACKSIFLFEAKSFLYQGVFQKTENSVQESENSVQESEKSDVQKLEGIKASDHKDISEMNGLMARLAKIFLNETVTLEKSLQESCLETHAGTRKNLKNILEPTKLDRDDVSSAISALPDKLFWHEAVASGGIINSFLWCVTTVLEDLDDYCHLHKTMNWRWFVQESCLQPLHDLESVLTKILLDIILPIQLDCPVIANDPYSMRETSIVKDDRLDLKQATDEKLCNKSDQTNYSFSLEEQLSGDFKSNLHNKMLNENGTNFVEINISLGKAVKKLSDQQFKFLGELFMSLAALVKLRSLFCSCYATCSDADIFKSKQMPFSLCVLLGLAYHLMSSVSFWVENRNAQNMVWLFSSIKCMESFGSLLPCMKPLLSSLAFAKLVKVHIYMLGRLLPTSYNSYNVIKLSSSHSTCSTGKTGRAESDHQDKEICVMNVDDFDQLKNAVKSSFGALIKDAPRQHLILALQAIERAILNIWDGFEMGHGLEFSVNETGTVPRIVAAGIECLGIAIEAVSGPRRLQLLARHCPTFLAAIFNLLEHLQGRALFGIQGKNDFFETQKEIEVKASQILRLKTVHSASAVLESLEILTRVSSRPVIFPMRSRHVALSLHCPANLLKEVYVNRISSSFSQHRMLFSRKPQYVAAGSHYIVHLYRACCKLLSALVRHRRRESGHCVALLGESISVLLYCLESGQNLPAVADWDFDDVVECAHWLQRVYEEVGAHKDAFGRYCCHLLANYLSVLCGSGPCAAGFHRDVERALRPGVFALIDGSSAMDLQQLHVTLGEGPERNALTALRHDYEKHYKYRGKV